MNRKTKFEWNKKNCCGFNMQNNFKKTFSAISILTIFSLCFYIPLTALAVDNPTDQANVDTLTQQASTLQTSGATAQGLTGTDKTTQTKSAAGGITAGALSCSVGAIASKMIVSTVAKATGVVTGAITNLLGGKVTAIVTDTVTGLIDPMVPVNPKGTNTETIRDNTGNNAQSTQLLAYKGVTQSAPGDARLFNGITSIFSGIFQFPSLDAIGFCIANEMIQYIADSTIQWIKTGFKGSPVFISNTGDFFKGIQDQELGNFVNGVAKGTLGIDMCQPFRVAILTDVLDTYSNTNSGGSLNCSLNTIKNNYKQFTNGDWNSGGFNGWFEIIQQPNNIYGATLAAQDEAYRRIQVKQNTATIDLGWSRGYHDFTYCQDKGSLDKKTNKCANGKDPVKGTPGQYIENQINARGAAGMNRLNVAVAFDQVVSTLVNELVKIAVNKVLDPTSK
ncbi:MAG: hypothetical protein WCV55_01995 [Candidatus Paceibacterota bacterium]